MKTVTLLKNGIKNLFIVFITLLSISVSGQVQQNGVLYIEDAGVVSVFTTPYNFGTSPATIKL